jgi:hypothetical protein
MSRRNSSSSGRYFSTGPICASPRCISHNSGQTRFFSAGKSLNLSQPFHGIATFWRIPYSQRCRVTTNERHRTDSDGAEHLFDAFPRSVKRAMERAGRCRPERRGIRNWTWKTYEGFSVEPMYLRADIDSLAHLGSLPDSIPMFEDAARWERGKVVGRSRRATHAALPEACRGGNRARAAKRTGWRCAALDSAAVLGSGSEDASLRAGTYRPFRSSISTDFQRISERLQTGFRWISTPGCPRRFSWPWRLPPNGTFRMSISILSRI